MSPFPPSPTSSLQNPTPKTLPRRPHFPHYYTQYWSNTRHFSSNREDDDDKVGGSGEEDELELVKRLLSGGEKGRGGGDWLQIGEPTRALRSGFQAVRPGFCCRSDWIAQVQGEQWPMSNGDSIFTERLKFYEVNDKALDAKVIIFKKKRRKNYCRTKVHRQELTKLRITDIQGI